MSWLTCDETSLPLEGILAAVQHFDKVIQPGGLDVVEAVEEALGQRAGQAHDNR